MALGGTRNIAFVLLFTALPGDFALAAGGGAGARGGAVGGGVGSAGTLGLGAAVGGGAPAGRVGAAPLRARSAAEQWVLPIWGATVRRV